MEPAPAKALEDEIVAIESALETLDEATTSLQSVMTAVADLVRETAEAPFMPNYQRAQEQLQVAFNAADGARRVLRRRQELRRRALARG